MNATYVYEVSGISPVTGRAIILRAEAASAASAKKMAEEAGLKFVVARDPDDRALPDSAGGA